MWGFLIPKLWGVSPQIYGVCTPNEGEEAPNLWGLNLQIREENPQIHGSEAQIYGA